MALVADEEFERHYDAMIAALEKHEFHDEADDARAARTFARKMRLRMEALRLSSNAVAERMGHRSHAAITSYYWGSRKPRKGAWEKVEISKRPYSIATPGLPTIQRLARALNCTVAYLTDDAIDDPKGGTARPELTPDRERILSLADAIGLEDADTILTIVRRMGGSAAFELLTKKPNLLNIPGKNGGD